MSFTVTGFDGTVSVKHSMVMPDGRSWWAFSGKVSILEAKAMLGFDVKDDSNWIARIESQDGSRSINIPGCQVSAVLQGAFPEDSPGTGIYVL